MRPCISQASTLSSSFESDCDAYALAGWDAVEVWLTKLETFLESRPIDEARSLLESRGLKAVAAAAQGGLLLSKGSERAAHWGLFGRRLAILGELGVSTLVVSADFPGEVAGDDYARAVESLVEAADLARSFGVKLALEFQKNSRFCASLDTASALVAQADHDWLGICLDLFHYYTGPSKFEDLGYLNRRNLAWVQVSDLSGVPREVAGDSDRILPGEGDFLLDPILDQLGSIGSVEFLSLEVPNPMLWAVPPDRLADAGLRAMRRTIGQRQSAPASPLGH